MSEPGGPGTRAASCRSDCSRKSPAAVESIGLPKTSTVATGAISTTRDMVHRTRDDRTVALAPTAIAARADSAPVFAPAMVTVSTRSCACDFRSGGKSAKAEKVISLEEDERPAISRSEGKIVSGSSGSTLYGLSKWSVIQLTVLSRACCATPPSKRHTDRVQASLSFFVTHVFATERFSAPRGEVSRPLGGLNVAAQLDLALPTKPLDANRGAAAPLRDAAPTEWMRHEAAPDGLVALPHTHASPQSTG